MGLVTTRIDGDYKRRFVWMRVYGFSDETARTHGHRRACRQNWRSIVPDWQGWELESIDDANAGMDRDGHYYEGCFVLIEEDTDG